MKTKLVLVNKTFICLKRLWWFLFRWLTICLRIAQNKNKARHVLSNVTLTRTSLGWSAIVVPTSVIHVSLSPRIPRWQAWWMYSSLWRCCFRLNWYYKFRSYYLYSESNFYAKNEPISLIVLFIQLGVVDALLVFDSNTDFEASATLKLAIFHCGIDVSFLLKGYYTIS